jgi:AhpD family alkylhydroperoxidase
MIIFMEECSKIKYLFLREIMKPSTSFNRRYYNHLGEIISDAKQIKSKRKQIKFLMRGGTLSEAFRERIMLAVTEVNGCRYCQYAHAKMALDAGLTKDEIEALTSGSFHNCPEDEIPALLYAQHWAEKNGQPDMVTRQNVVELYDEVTVEDMELAMRMIRMGNLLGNTWDYVLFRLSFGKLGN